ncbi:MAG: HEAT repeat domain-containing protein [Candidatus Riflebacteria bacterium]|nr:HEAT repeat domain-containing protein [Candidatus Riflebacteria bacterium]
MKSTEGSHHSDGGGRTANPHDVGVEDFAEVLLAELSAASADRRRLAAAGLSRSLGFSVVQQERLALLLHAETDPQVRVLIQQAIENGRPADAGDGTNPLDWDLTVRLAVVKSLPCPLDLGRDQVTKKWFLGETDAGVLVIFLGKLVSVADAVVADRLQELLRRSDWPTIQVRALRLLAGHDIDRVSELLAGFLVSGHPLLRIETVRVLERHFPAEAARFLREALLSSDPEMRFAGLQAAFTVDFREIALAVQHILLQETDSGVLRLAVILAVNNPDPEIALRLHAKALRATGGRSAVLHQISTKLFEASKLIGLVAREVTPDLFFHQSLASPAPTPVVAGPSASGEDAPRVDAPAEEVPFAPVPPSAAELLAQLKSRNPREVAAAVDALGKSAPEELLPHLQSLLRHADPRVRLKMQGVLERIDPGAVQSVLQNLLRQPTAAVRQQGVRLGSLMDPVSVMPFLLEAYDRETDPGLKRDLELFFVNNPSPSLLRHLIQRLAVREERVVRAPEVVAQVHAGLSSLAGGETPPLAVLLEEHAPHPAPVLPTMTRLAKDLRQIHFDPDRPGSRGWKGFFQEWWEALRHQEGFPTRWAMVAGVGLVTLLGLGISRSWTLSAPTVDRQTTDTAIREEVILDGRVVAVSPQQVIVKTSTGIFRIGGGDFGSVQPGWVGKIKVRPNGSPTKSNPTDGQFVAWER